MQDKPADIEQYKKWLRTQHNVEITTRTQNHYDSATFAMNKQFEMSPFWKELGDKLQDYNDEYKVTKGNYWLFSETKLPEVKIKPFQSFLDKTFRKNIIQNKNWPNEPNGGWLLPDNWYSCINDILRTFFVVKYLDGVEFLRDKVHKLCQDKNQSFSCDFEARMEGYYALHMYTKMEFEIPRITWDTEKITSSIEIQITTQLQEVIRTLLHKYYEQRRGKISAEDGTTWQWDYRSEEFATNYLGHILHYLEGMIMDIREKEKKQL